MDVLTNIKFLSVLFFLYTSSFPIVKHGCLNKYEISISVILFVYF